MKKFLNWMMCLLLGLALLPTAVLAADTDEISVEASAPSANESGWSVVLKLSGSESVSNGKIRISYDASQLSLKTDEAGDLLKDSAVVINDCLEGNKDEGEIVLVFASSGTIDASGTLLTMTFDVKAEDGSTIQITPEIEEFKNGDDDVSCTAKALGVVVGSTSVDEKESTNSAAKAAEASASSKKTSSTDTSVQTSFGWLIALFIIAAAVLIVLAVAGKGRKKSDK